MRCAAFVLGLMLSCTVLAQSRFDNQPITSNTATAQSADGEVATPRPQTGGVSLWRIVFSLAGVIGLILLARPALRKMNGAGHSGERGLVRVLTRTTIGPRQQVLVLAVGRTVMVVGDSGGKLSPLGTIDDHEEAARLLGQAASVSSADDADMPKVTPFSGIFHRQQAAYEPAPLMDAPEARPASDADGEDGDGEMNQAQQELAGLLRRVRALQDEVRIER